MLPAMDVLNGKLLKMLRKIGKLSILRWTMTPKGPKSQTAMHCDMRGRASAEMLKR